MNDALVRTTGYEVTPVERRRARPLPPREPVAQLPQQCDDEARRTIRAVRPHPGLADDALHALIVATRHVSDQAVPGALVAYGNGSRGAMEAVARTLVARGVLDRDLHVVDPAAEGASDAVEAIAATSYPAERVHAGVDAAGLPEPLALLHLAGAVEGPPEEPRRLYERLAPGGVLIVDHDVDDALFRDNGATPLLVPTASGRVAIKPAH